MVVLIGAEHGGCGKSSVATNLAVLLAREGRDVLLLDADIQPTSKRRVDRRNERHESLSVPSAQTFGKRSGS